MKKLYLIWANEYKELKADKDFMEFWLYIYYGKSKIYKCQFDDLMLLESEIVVITTSKKEIEYWQSEIKEFYKKFPTRSD